MEGILIKVVIKNQLLKAKSKNEQKQGKYLDLMHLIIRKYLKGKAAII